MDSETNRPLRYELLGALVGLARATDGNEHLFSHTTIAAVTAGLEALERARSEGLEETLGLVREEKRRLVPDCFRCACPCGRTSDFDAALLLQEPETIRRSKENLLAAACGQAGRAGESKAFFRLLCKALFAVGCDDWTPEELDDLAREVASV